MRVLNFLRPTKHNIGLMFGFALGYILLLFLILDNCMWSGCSRADAVLIALNWGMNSWIGPIFDAFLAYLLGSAIGNIKNLKTFSL